MYTHDRQGSTLVGTLTAMVLAGIMMLGIGNQAELIGKSERASSLRAGTQELESLIQYAIRYPDACNKAVAGVPLSFDSFGVSPFKMKLANETLQVGTRINNGQEITAFQLENPQELSTNFYRATLRLVTSEKRHKDDQRFIGNDGIDYDFRKRNRTIPFFFVADSSLTEVQGCVAGEAPDGGEVPKFHPDIGDKLCQFYAQQEDVFWEFNNDAIPNCLISRLGSRIPAGGTNTVQYHSPEVQAFTHGISTNDIFVNEPVVVKGDIRRIVINANQNHGKSYKVCLENGENCPGIIASVNRRSEPPRTSPRGTCSKYTMEVTGITMEEWEASNWAGHPLSNMNRTVSCPEPGERIFDSSITMSSFGGGNNANNTIYMEARVIAKTIVNNQLTFTVDWFNPYQKAIVELRCCQNGT